MIFHELYGCYYQAVSRMLACAVEGDLTIQKMHEIIRECTFEESILTIMPSIQNQQWQLLDEHLETPLVDIPRMPLTLLEKRWLKTILQDARIVLFGVPEKVDPELSEVEPLFHPQDIVYFDRYLDGDRYDQLNYIHNFRTMLQAVRLSRKVRLRFWNGKGQIRSGVYAPIKMEYSDKEDKFRVLCAGAPEMRVINMGRVIRCAMLDEGIAPEDRALPERRFRTLELELIDKRNTLERAMMRFSHYKKEAQRIAEDRYRVILSYEAMDETDLLIQILSFGPYVKIIEPGELKDEIAERIRKQLELSKC